MHEFILNRANLSHKQKSQFIFDKERLFRRMQKIHCLEWLEQLYVYLMHLAQYNQY